MQTNTEVALTHDDSAHANLNRGKRRKRVVLHLFKIQARMCVMETSNDYALSVKPIAYSFQ